MEKLFFRLYVSKKTGDIFPPNADETAIDMDKPLQSMPLPKYKKIGENNHFIIYELKSKYVT